jgi:metallophosphoesterase superfamily enzyme
MGERAGPQVEPIPNEPAATADLDGERLLLLADYHAGIEAGLRYERGVELPDNAAERRDRLCGLLDRRDADRLVVLGDLGHRIGSPGERERAELDALFAAVVDERGVAITVAPGNHDGDLAAAVGDRAGVDVLDAAGGLLGEPPAALGVLHGHTWPAPELSAASTICLGHEHPQVNLTDSVGGSRTERAWLRGRLDSDVLADAVEGWHSSASTDGGDGTRPAAISGPEVVVFPAFNDRSGGTWLNVPEQEFLSPFLPAALDDADCYLLDGTRLGAYRTV